VPVPHLRLQPQLNAAAADFNDRARHIGISTLVGVDGIPVTKAQELSHALSVDQVFSPNKGSHAT
jgi:hypothetical protein